MNTNFTLCPIRAAYTMRSCVVQTLGPQNAWNAMRRRVFWIQPAQIMDRAQSSYTLSKETKKGLGRRRCRAIWSPTAPQEFRSVGALKKRTWSQYRRRYSQLRLHRDLLESFEALMHFCSGKTAIIYSYTVYVLDAHLCFQNIQENEHYNQYRSLCEHHIPWHYGF